MCCCSQKPLSVCERFLLLFLDLIWSFLVRSRPSQLLTFFEFETFMWFEVLISSVLYNKINDLKGKVWGEIFFV